MNQKFALAYYRIYIIVIIQLNNAYNEPKMNYLFIIL